MRKHQHKPLYWLGDSLEALKQFSDAAMREAGHQLNRVQEGFEPDDWKPMTTVGVGVKKVRIKSEKAYRVMCVATYRYKSLVKQRQ